MKSITLDLVFPRPRNVRVGHGMVRLPRTLGLTGEPMAPWLRARLARACRSVGVELRTEAACRLQMELKTTGFASIRDPDCRTEAYRLTLDANGSMHLCGPSPAGLRHGIITLCLLLEARAAGARLSPMVVTDAPVFSVRGFQIDMAREFFPSPAFLKRMINRAVDLKFNTIWLYLENHFRAPGLEDLSQKEGMTPAEARELSAYAAVRGIDLVPGTNVLSHMEGWFRLERYSDFSDGAMRSYPLLTHPRTWPLVQDYLDALAEAFPSKNFHAGLDELLFTGTNPEAAAAIRKKGKAAYFADFACKVIRHLQEVHGKTVWMWDDMVLGKNVFRPEGFNQDYRKALDRIPRDAVMTHWYYWTDRDGKHAPIIERVAKEGRPFVVAPSNQSYTCDFGSLKAALENQSYMARCGQSAGAFGLVCTHWESRYGSSYLASWPLQALAAGFAWSGGGRPGPGLRRSLSLALTGDHGALLDFLQLLDRVQDVLAENKVGHCMVRSSFFLDGPHVLWRRFTGVLPPARRREIRRLLERARRTYRNIGRRDLPLKRALRLGMALFEEALHVMDAFDRAWDEYHRAAELERTSGAGREFERRIEGTNRNLEAAAKSIERYRRVVVELERRTGHTPYDGYALTAWIEAVRSVTPLIRAAVRDGGGLPCFEKLLYLPPCYYGSNLRQLQVQNTFHHWFGDGRNTVSLRRRTI